MKGTNTWRWLAILLLALTAFAAPINAFAQETAPTQAPKDYIIGPEDILLIITRDMPEASGDFMVRPDGTISFPIAGTLKVSGMTPSKLEQELIKALKKELRDPVVTVNVRQMRINRIYISGMVSRVNFYDFKPGWRLTELIAAAGGLIMIPERLTATIFRVGQPNMKVSMREVFVEGKDSANVTLQPGDVINILSEATVRVTISGKVVRPGAYDIEEGQGIIEALASAGGNRPEAALSKTKVLRKGEEIPVDLYAAITKGEVTNNIKLENGDSIIVPEIFSRVSVMGTVNRPGTHLMPDGIPYTLTQAIGDAGGPAREAKTDGIIVARQDDSGKVQQFQFDLKDITGGKATDFKLQDRDVVFVPQSGKANTQQVGGLMNLWFLARNLFGIR